MLLEEITIYSRPEYPPTKY